MTIRVLAVDDSKTMRDLISAALPGDTFVVTTAEDGRKGLAAVGSIPPDVIVTDINMPHLDGYGFITELRDRDETRKTPILVLTTESAPGFRLKAQRAGATGWIVKPFDPEKLKRALLMVAG